MKLSKVIVLTALVYIGVAYDTEDNVSEISELLSTESEASPEVEEPSGALGPDDFIRGSLVKESDISEDGIDPIPNSGKFEGDIDLRGLTYESYVDSVTDDSPYEKEDEIGSNAIRGKWHMWPNAEVPYEIDTSAFGRYDRGVIAAAIEEYEKHTCVRWIPRQSHHQDYVRFIDDSGCYSTVGRFGGKQGISLGNGCVTKGIVIHEMMHAIGFFHEQARADRNGYVRVVWDNILNWARGNFKRMTLEEIDHLETNYDFGSVMHYGKNYFSKNGQDTIIVKNSNHRIGQRRGFSKTDIDKINKLYKCLHNKVVVTPRPMPVPQFCADENEHCSWWAQHNQCIETPGYMLKYCKRSCKQCGTHSNCHDRKKYCTLWKEEGFCERDYVAYMKKYCKKSCGHC